MLGRLTTLLCLAAPLQAASAGYLHLDIERRPAATGRSSARTRRQDVNAALTQASNKLEYLVNITVGTPAQKMAVTLDTGSSDLWVPAVSSNPCKKGDCTDGSFDPSRSTSYNVVDQGGFNITYAGPGDSDAGSWVEENVSVGGSRTVNQTIIGVALDGYDSHGVMGIGFDTNEAQPNPDQNGVYPSVLDNMVQQGIVNTRAYSLYLNDHNQTGGSVCFGCVDSTKYEGDLIALPLQESPGGGVREFMVTLTSVSFTDASGAVTQLSPPDYAQSVLLDSGTSATLLTDDVFTALADGFGATYLGEESYVVPCGYTNTNASMTYTFGGHGGPSVTVPVAEAIGQQEISSREYDQASGGCDFGFGPPIDGISILGDTFLRNAYVVFDLDNRQAAVAQAVGERASTSSLQVMSSGTALPGVGSTATASGTQLNDAAATSAVAVPSASASGSTVLAGTPTFNLGASATSSGAGVTSGSGTSNVAMSTKAPHAAVLGAGIVAGVFLW